MKVRSLGFLGAALVGGVLSVSGPAWAPEDAETGEAALVEAGVGEAIVSDSAESDSADQAPTDENAEPTADELSAVEAAEAGDSPVELPGKTYHFVGLRYRGVIVPEFMMNLFGDGGATVYVNGVGPEFTVREDGFEYVLSAWWAGYYMDDRPFKAKDDPQDAWEIVESDLNVVYLTADFLWSSEIVEGFSVNYGGGVGLGAVFGTLNRTEAYPEGGGTIGPDGEGAVACDGPGQPVAFSGFCEQAGNYGPESSWANGGSKPIVFPWFALQTGLRYKPHKNFVARLDAGFGLSGFFLGLAANYGL